VSPVKYKLGLYIPEDDILHSHASHAALPMVTSKFFALTQPVNSPSPKRQKKINFNSTG
jgi:hypothetical protein